MLVIGSRCERSPRLGSIRFGLGSSWDIQLTYTVKSLQIYHELHRPSPEPTCLTIVLINGSIIYRTWLDLLLYIGSLAVASGIQG